MAKSDGRGNPVSYPVQDAIDALDHAFELLHAYQADPLGAVDEIIADHPDFTMAHAFRAGALATATDKAFESELRKSVEAAEVLASNANDRERMYVSAARAWLDGHWERATELWGRVSIAYPRDLLALQFAHLGDFFLGCSHGCAIASHASCRTGIAACRATASSRECTPSDWRKPANTSRPRHMDVRRLN
jgi:hypothetical protein